MLQAQFLMELMFKQSCYGREIPIIYGQITLCGNIIWYGETREEKHTKVRDFGKIFKNKEYNDYYLYYATFAIMLCEGEVDEISRIWADDEELFLSDYNLTKYYGSEDQQPDPTIVSYKGIENTQAYRGLCYVVLKNFPIDPKRSTIPKFKFEVIRSMIQNPLLDKIKALSLGPGYGEYIYDTQICYKKFYSKFDHGIIYHEGSEPLNLIASLDSADAMISLKKMTKQFQKLSWVSIDICWFANSTDISGCKIYPTIEFKEWEYTHPVDWKVGNYNRQHARVAAKDAKGYFLYGGGTPSDNSLLNLIGELRKKKLKIMIHPRILVENAEKSWCGDIGGDAKHLNKFYDGDEGYNKFILHYANLLKDHIDAFIIGSDLTSLNKIKINNQHPNIAKLKELLTKTKQIFASRDIKVTYGADISELDLLSDLWNDLHLDVIGINAYFASNYDLAKLNSLHPTKKIWFTCAGFPSVKNCEASPKVNRYNAQSEEDIDFRAQELALNNALDRYCGKNIIEQVFVFYYDMR